MLYALAPFPTGVSDRVMAPAQEAVQATLGHHSPGRTSGQQAWADN